MTFAEYSDHWLERKRKRLKNSTVATYEALLRSYLLPAFGSSTGLRPGECLGLTVDRAESLRRTMRIDRQLANTHGGFGFGTTKTHAAVRTIPVPAHVTDMLAAHLAEFPAGDDGLIFTMVVTRQNPAGWWPRTTEPVEHHDREACAVAGVVDRTRTHDLRHVAASALIAGALSVAAVQAVLGNASPAETLEVYTHLWPTDEERTRAAIEAASASWMRVPTAARA